MPSLDSRVGKQVSQSNASYWGSLFPSSLTIGLLSGGGHFANSRAFTVVGYLWFAGCFSKSPSHLKNLMIFPLVSSFVCLFCWQVICGWQVGIEWLTVYLKYESLSVSDLVLLNWLIGSRGCLSLLSTSFKLQKHYRSISFIQFHSID